MKLLLTDNIYSQLQLCDELCISQFRSKCELFYSQESSRGEFTTRDCGGHLSTTYSNATEIAQRGILGCSRPQPATIDGM